TEKTNYAIITKTCVIPGGAEPQRGSPMNSPGLARAEPTRDTHRKNLYCSAVVQLVARGPDTLFTNCPVPPTGQKHCCEQTPVFQLHVVLFLLLRILLPPPLRGLLLRLPVGNDQPVF